MPSTSKKQHNFMAAVAHSPAFAKKVGIAQSVGKDFTEADKGRKFGKGGSMATPAATAAVKIPSSRHSRPDLQKINAPKTNQGANELFKKGGSTMATKASNLFKGKETYSEELKEAKALKSGKITPQQYAKGEKSEGVHKMAKGGSTGSFRASANGIAQRGKTKAAMPKMAGSTTGMKKGGKC